MPVDTVRRVVPSSSHGRYRHLWTGFVGYSITPGLARTLELPGRGILVARITRGGPAARAGLQGATKEVIVGTSCVLAGGTS